MTASGALVAGMSEIVARGIDVSYAQGVVDWPKVAKGVDFAIIRATATYPGPGRSGVDTRWECNIQGARKAGVPIGAYHYSYAKDIAEMQAEARHFLNTIRPYRFEWPVCLDFEEAYQIGGPGTPGYPLSKQMDMIDAWMKLVQEAGYFAALYSTGSAVKRLRDTYPDRMAKYAVWVAHVDTDKPMTPGGIWQYSWRGKVDGIAGDVDLNYAYEDYPSIIKWAGLNGWGMQDKPSEGPQGETPDYSTDDLKAAYSALQAAHDATGAALEKLRTMLGV